MKEFQGKAFALFKAKDFGAWRSLLRTVGLEDEHFYSFTVEADEDEDEGGDDE